MSCFILSESLYYGCPIIANAYIEQHINNIKHLKSVFRISSLVLVHSYFIAVWVTKYPRLSKAFCIRTFRYFSEPCILFVCDVAFVTHNTGHSLKRKKLYLYYAISIISGTYFLEQYICCWLM